MTAQPADDLRSRRRTETSDAIHQAALELFESQGVRETTVQQIAERVGISSRTFFRYFTSKEQAALPGQRRLLEAIDTLELGSAELSSVLEDIEGLLQAAVGQENDPEMVEYRRVTRLLAREPDLRALAATQEEVLTERLRDRLAASFEGADRLAVLLVAEVAVAVWRATWRHWGELELEGGEAHPIDHFRRLRAELRTIVR
ncbi:TetR family transcriptional regulator [Raineyella antarctica]|uniref:TetR family transcriptional regulator n=1 Tax=Raineyella antarctica TaxID=1577474 RepID=UPI0015881A8A|nr:TetR family transcriptional regulator [Raineyella antarctica]